MSQPCAAPKCDRVSRVSCDCCKQNLCVRHFNEHNASLVSQLNPLTDEINALGDRLNKLNIQQMLANCREKLEEWRLDCHQTIDRFFEQKCQELDHLVVQKIDEQRKEILSVQTKLDKLIRDEEASRQDIDQLTSTIRQLETEMNKIEQTRFSVSTHPLLIDDNAFQVKEIDEKELDPLIFSSVYRTIEFTGESSFAIASNDRVLLMHQAPNLCFLDNELTIVKQVLWPHDDINDMCWSSTLDRFIVIAKDSIYLVNKNTASIETMETVVKRDWSSCACSRDQLFLTTNVFGASIVEIGLPPSIIIIKEWKAPVACERNEFIDDIVYNNGTLAIVISNECDNSTRMELRCCKTLNRLWLFLLDTTYQNIALRCCSLEHNGWVLADFNADRLLHITADGKMKQIIEYLGKPYRVNLFGSNELAISTNTSLNFHKI